MPSSPLKPVLDGLTPPAFRHDAEVTDGQLLGRYVTGQDGAAVALIIQDPEPDTLGAALAGS
jgi:hypothetical protein